MTAGTIKPKDGYREFIATRDNKSTVRLSVRHPGKREVESADLEYSGTFNRMLMGGLPTQAKLLRELRDNQIISLKDEEEIGQLSQELRVLNERLQAEAYKGDDPVRKAADEAERKQLQLDRANKNRRLGVLNSEINEMLAHTADAKSAEAQRNFLIACVVEYADGDKKGQRLYDDVEELLAENDGELLNRILYAYMVCQSDQPDEWDSLFSNATPKAPEAPPEAAVQAAVVAAAVAAAPVVELDPKADAAV